MNEDLFEQTSNELGIPKTEIAAIFIDDEKKQKMVFMRSQILNQLQKECIKVNESFDLVYMDEFKLVSSELSEITPLIYLGIQKASKNNNEVLITCGNLVKNASTTIVSSIQTLRCGFRLQSGVLLRSAIEMCASAVHLYTKPKDLQVFKANKFKSTTSIAIANKTIPIFAKNWGILSNKLIHINSIHTESYILSTFEDKNEIPVEITLGIIGLTNMILRATTELLFNENIDSLKYWERINSTLLKFHPSGDGKLDWIKEKLKK